MNTAQKQLLERITNFSIDTGGEELTFVRRLARENGWSVNVARRVIDEYKRFAFLAVEAGHPVTPSDEVDQAWHLHLTYTRSYWDDFCGRVLRMPLHHGPTRGGSNEAAKFHDWYAKTLDSYARLFGEPPPRDIWPDAAKRFDPRARFERVDVASKWVIRKPRMPRSIAMRVLLGSVATAATMGAFVTLEPTAPYTLVAGFNDEFPIWIIIGVVVIMVLLPLIRRAVGRSCLACHRNRALRKTGRIRREGKREATEVEWQCRYCKHVEWIAGHRGGGFTLGCAGGGCSGCSGCGGGGCGGGCGGCGGG